MDKAYARNKIAVKRFVHLLLTYSCEQVYSRTMAKRNHTNEDGYQAVMAALEKQGYKSPQSDLARLLGFAGRQGTNNWKGRIPPMHAFMVSCLTGVPMATILPETVKEAERILDEEALHQKARERAKGG